MPDIDLNATLTQDECYKTKKIATAPNQYQFSMLENYVLHSLANLVKEYQDDLDTNRFDWMTETQTEMRCVVDDLRLIIEQANQFLGVK